MDDNLLIGGICGFVLGALLVVVMTFFGPYHARDKYAAAFLRETMVRAGTPVAPTVDAFQRRLDGQVIWNAAQDSLDVRR